MSDASIDKIAFVFLGWLLGMLGPIVVEAIKRRRENALGRAAILTELNGLTETLALAAYGARMRLGTADRPFLEWLKSDLETHSLTPRLQEFVPRLRTQLSWTDEDLKKVALHMSADDGMGTMLQRYSVPLLDARVSALWTFDTSFQRQLLEIRTCVALLDDLVDRGRKYFDLTFTKLEGDNYRLVTENLEQVYSLYGERAKATVDQIRKLKSGST